MPSPLRFAARELFLTAVLLSTAPTALAAATESGAHAEEPESTPVAPASPSPSPRPEPEATPAPEPSRFSPPSGEWTTTSEPGAPDRSEPPPTDESKGPPILAVPYSLGAHYLFAQGKAMPGITIWVGKDLFAGALETSLIWLTEPDPEHRFRFLGSQLGAFFLLSPLHTERFELEAGLGGDFYPLWNIHSDEWQIALAVRAAGHVRVTSKLWLFGTARAYPISTHGLELGVGRDGTHGLFVLFGAGTEWRFQ